MTTPISSQVLNISFDERQMYKLALTKSRKELIRYAEEATSRSIEQQEIASRYSVLTKYSLLVSTINSIATAIFFALAESYGIIGLTPAFLVPAVSIALLNLTTLVVTLYCLVKHSTHLKNSENYKSLTIEADRLESKLSVFNDRGVLTGLILWLFGSASPMTHVTAGSSSSSSRNRITFGFNI